MKRKLIWLFINIVTWSELGCVELSHGSAAGAVMYLQAQNASNVARRRRDEEEAKKKKAPQAPRKLKPGRAP